MPFPTIRHTVILRLLGFFKTRTIFSDWHLICVTRGYKFIYHVQDTEHCTWHQQLGTMEIQISTKYESDVCCCQPTEQGQMPSLPWHSWYPIIWTHPNYPFPSSTFWDTTQKVPFPKVLHFFLGVGEHEKKQFPLFHVLPGTSHLSVKVWGVCLLYVKFRLCCVWRGMGWGMGGGDRQDSKQSALPVIH